MLAFVVVVVGEDEDEGASPYVRAQWPGMMVHWESGKEEDEDSTGKQKISAVGGVAPISR